MKTSSIDIRSVLYIIGNLLLVLSGSLILPLIAALLIDDGIPLERFEIIGFVGAMISAAIVGLSLRALFETDLSKVAHREGAAIVTLCWISFSLIGSMPYWITGATNFTDAFFETMSGFTTTGSTILTNVEILPSGLQLWRHQTQWMGGMGIVVLSIAILPMLGAGGYRLFKAEAPGGAAFKRNMPRIKDTAKVLWLIYLGFTAVELLLLWGGGMSFYEALCHAFTTMSTGGFSTKAASIAAWPSPFIQWTIIVFMYFAGVNFDIFQQLVLGPRRAIIENSEFIVYTAVALGVSIIISLILWAHQSVNGGFEATYRHSLFAVLTVSTTTGYGTEDFDKWPDIVRLSLLLIMFVGGSTGSTAGGMKVARMIIFVKAAIAELKRTVNPKAVIIVRVGKNVIPPNLVSNVQAFILMWLSIVTISTILMTAMGHDLLTSMSATVANLGNIGPGLAEVGPTCNFAHLSDPAKWLMILMQLAGRLEIYSVLVLFLPQSWVR